MKIVSSYIRGGSLMNMVVIGAGSLGLLLSAKLAPLCNHLELVTNTQKQAETLRTEGIGLLNHTLRPSSSLSISSYESNNEYKSNESVDYVILAVKQSALNEQFIHYVSTRLGESGKLVCFQNGIGHIEQLEAKIGLNRIFVAITTEGAKRNSAHSVVHTGQGITYIGSPTELLTEDCSSDQVKQSSGTDIKDLCELLKKAGFCAEASNQVLIKVWNKLVINCVINPLTAILRIYNGQLLESEYTIRLMRDLYNEALKVAEAESIALSEDLWNQLLEVCERTAGNQSSMLQDRIAGRVTEIDWINGALLKIGDQHHIDLPVNRTVYHIVKTMEISQEM